MNYKALGILNILLVLGVCTLTWVPWPFTVISQPKEAHATALALSDSRMTKESTLSMHFDIEVIEDSYVWFGVKNIALDNGRVLHGNWTVSPNGTYQKGEKISAQFKLSTGNHTDSYVCIFTDSTTRLELKFSLPPYRMESLS